MSKFSNALHAVFGFVKTEVPNIEAEAKVIRDKAEADVAALRVKAAKLEASQTVTDIKASLAKVTAAVTAHVATLEAAPAVTGPTGPAA